MGSPPPPSRHQFRNTCSVPGSQYPVHRTYEMELLVDLAVIWTEVAKMEADRWNATPPLRVSGTRQSDHTHLYTSPGGSTNHMASRRHFGIVRYSSLSGSYRIPVYSLLNFSEPLFTDLSDLTSFPCQLPHCVECCQIHFFVSFLLSNLKNATKINLRAGVAQAV
jgi:hypothetical protein